MDILTEDMKKELKEKFKALDINDEHFQEKAQEIIDEAIVGNKDKIGETVVQKTVDEALEEQKEGIKELNQLIDEGILEKTKDDEARDYLEELATHGIIDEVAEKASLEAAGFLKEPNKATTVEDIVEEILKQLEEVIDEKKRVVEEKIQKNEDMLGKVQKREDLRSARLKVDNLHKKTRNYKGTEGKRFNQNVEAVITDLDKQINALVIATTVDGNELQSDALKEERQKLTEEKQKLEDMSKFLKEKYTKDHAKEASTTIIKDEVSQIMGEIKYGMNPNTLVEKAEAIRKIYDENKGQYTDGELLTIFKDMPLQFQEDKDLKLSAASLVDIGKTNDIRRLYIRTTNLDEEDRTDKDKENIKKCKESFAKEAIAIERICKGKKLLPLKTENEYIAELETLDEDVEKAWIKGIKARDVASISRKLRRVLKEVITETTPNRIEKAFNKLRSTLERNKAKDLPEAFDEKEENKEKPPVVVKVKTPLPIGGEKGEAEGERTSGMKTPPKGDEGYEYDD